MDRKLSHAFITARKEFCYLTTKLLGRHHDMIRVRGCKLDADKKCQTRRLDPEAASDCKKITRSRAGVSDSVVTPCRISDRAIARLVQAAAAAGYTAADFAGHSLRTGFFTAATRSGADIFKMPEVSRHKSMQVLADYVRDTELFRDHADEGFL